MQTFSSAEVDAYVQQIVVSVFTSMLQLEVAPAALASWPPAHKLFTAAVAICGNDPIEVLLHLSFEQALSLAPRLMPIEPPSEMDENVCDAMREIINMIGGNLKGVLAPRSKLSIATVAIDDEKVPVHDLVSHYAFEGDCGVFWVSLLPQHQPALA